MTLRKKLFFGFSMILLLMTFVVSISASMLKKQNDGMAEIVQNRYKKIELVNVIEFERNNTAKSIRDVLLDPSTLNAGEINRIKESRQIANVTLQELLQVVENEEKKELVKELQVINLTYERDVLEVLDLLEEGNHEDAVRHFLTEEQKQVRTSIQAQGIALEEIEHQAMNEVLLNSKKDYTLTIQLILLVLGLALLIGIVVTRWVINDFSQSIHQVLNVITRLRLGGVERLPRIERISNDEIGKISSAINQMADTIECHMDQEEKFNNALKEKNWIETQISEVSTSLQGIQNINNLATLFLEKITPLLNANYGVLYIPKGSGADMVLEVEGSYAAESVPFQMKRFHLGEGLVGQCALDRREILLQEIPEDYIKIRSGLGETSPKSLLILPIIFEEKIMAVLEFASLQTFDSLHQILLNRLSTIVGIMIDSVNRQMQVKNLLEQSQSLTEELQTQSEELQMQHEELRSINDQLEKQYHDSEIKAKELEMTKLELEEQAKQLAASSQFKSEFLANMSHELRTPLNSILILAQIFAENKEGKLTQKQVEYAQSIHYAGKDLLNLINDILDLSKIESGKTDIFPAEVSVSEIESEITHQFLPVSHQKGLTFEVQHKNLDDHFTFSSDKQRLMQILKNLLSNAFKFTEAGSVILEFSKPRVQDYRKISKDIVLVTRVTDTGIGIPQEKQEIIFEAFRQVDGTMSRKHGGTGLGLSISRQLAQLLGGALEVESEEGQGSTFTLYLPNLSPNATEAALLLNEPSRNDLNLQAQPEKSEQPDRMVLPSEKAQFEGKKVLIVDDDMRNIFALTTALEKENMKVVFAENGKESIDKLLADSEIDLVLMDIMMPEMDGYSTMRAIREIPQFKDLPIIALTAKAMKNDREKCIAAGASDYISKPINMEQLHSLIRVWLYPITRGLYTKYDRETEE